MRIEPPQRIRTPDGVTLEFDRTAGGFNPTYRATRRNPKPDPIEKPGTMTRSEAEELNRTDPRKMMDRMVNGWRVIND